MTKYKAVSTPCIQAANPAAEDFLFLLNRPDTNLLFPFIIRSVLSIEENETLTAAMFFF